MIIAYPVSSSVTVTSLGSIPVQLVEVGAEVKEIANEICFRAKTEAFTGMDIFEFCPPVTLILMATQTDKICLIIFHSGNSMHDKRFMNVSRGRITFLLGSTTPYLPIPGIKAQHDKHPKYCKIRSCRLRYSKFWFQVYRYDTKVPTAGHGGY